MTSHDPAALTFYQVELVMSRTTALLNMNVFQDHVGLLFQSGNLWESELEVRNFQEYVLTHSEDIFNDTGFPFHHIQTFFYITFKLWQIPT